MNDVYKRLAEKLDAHPNGFPATESGVELTILRKIFSPEEAEAALKLRPIPETAEAIAERLGRPLDEVQSMLDAMVHKGQIASAKMFGNQVYLLAPFIIGIYEFQLNRMDKELADLMEEYGPDLAKKVGGYSPAFTRVVPINAKIDAKHEVLPYENLRRILEQAKSFELSECICRKERALHGQTCKHPLETCLAFSKSEGAFDKYARGKLISREEALRLVEDCEQEGLVHCTYNVQSDQMFVCNCCPCCCGLLRGLNEVKAPFLVAGSNFVAMIDTDNCAQCGVCADERCPVQAITEIDGVYAVQPERCIGCGACTTTCPTESIALVRKPEGQQDQPPANMMEWYGKRAESRGIKILID
jgi:Na+-translocating ferredoxin:NAD+ oxidoreductase subunit B